MAISRMQEPRQNYGLGSFVKKLTGKVTKPFTKVARKIVPKELAGIMRFAAPFLGPVAGPLAYLAGTAKQTGRISPMDLALAAIPRVSKMNLPDKNFLPTSIRGENIGQLVRDIDLPLDIGTVGDVALGDDGRAGIFGADGEMINVLKSPGDFLKTKPGQVLLGGGKTKYKGKMIKDPEKFNLMKAASLALTGGEYIRANKALQKLAEDTGDTIPTSGGVIDSDAYEKFLEQLAELNTEAFSIPNQYLQQPAANGGLMRTNYAMGSDDEPKPLPNDPTEPVNPFRPKPIGPFPSKMADIKSYSDYYKNLDLEKALRTFRMLKERDPEDMEELIQFFKDRKINAEKGGLMRSNYALGEMAMNQAPNMGMSPNLGSRPTEQESGLGGLPIEADMRYTGGFMPYGEVEKADDVPARLSKNEFVFTADAVRAAGGGSVQQGAKKMYDAMKKLEQQPEAKGAMA